MKEWTVDLVVQLKIRSVKSVCEGATWKMESGGFGSPHLSPPTLFAFSQVASANGLGGALQHRHYHPQVSICSRDRSCAQEQPLICLSPPKDHLSLMGSYGTHLLHGFPPHLLPSNLMSGGSGSLMKPFGFSSPAFQPPRDRASNELFRSSQSSSPAYNSRSPSVKEESMEGHSSEDSGHRDKISTPEKSPETPGFRRKWCSVRGG